MKIGKREKLNLWHGVAVVVGLGAVFIVSSERLQGFPFNAAFWKVSSPCTGTIVCGTNSGDNCYTGTTSAAAKTAGYAMTPSNKCLVYNNPI